VGGWDDGRDGGRESDVESELPAAAAQARAGLDPDSRQILDSINTELREQYLAAVRDRRGLEERLDAAAARERSALGLAPAAADGGMGGGGGGGGAAGAVPLAALTTPERRERESVELAKWREGEALRAQVRAKCARAGVCVKAY
jgi:hypothetical protein